MTLVLLSVAGGLLVLVLCSRYDHASVLRDWETALAPWEENTYRTLERRVEGESRVADMTYGRAFAALEGGSREEALRLLEIGVRLVQRTSPDMITLLRGMSLLSRMVTVVGPVRALRGRDFRIAELASLAAFGQLVHYVLVTTGERLRLRVFVLRKGFGVALALLFKSTARLRARDDDEDWDRIAAARADLQTLSAESLRTFHALLLSLNPRRATPR